jgi:hypothetical protein
MLSSAEKDDPTRSLENKENPDPIRELFLKDMLLDIWIWSRTERHDPRTVLLRIDTELPNLTKALKETADPASDDCKIDRHDPDCSLLNNDIELPSRDVPLIERVDPSHNVSKRLMLDPNCTLEKALSLDPARTKFRML